MARTKTSRRTQPANKKLVTPAQKKRIEVEIHLAPDWTSDVEHGDSNDVAVQAMSTPTVSLEDINFLKSTPKLSGSMPVIQRQSDSEESAIAATPTSSRKSLPPPTSGSVEPPVPKRRKRSENYMFTDEQEADLSEWYQHHPMFYEKGDKDYKNAEKNSLLEEKGSTMHPPCTCKYYSHKCLNINM